MTDPSPSIELTRLRDWIGRTERRRDTLAPAPLAGLAATLDLDGAGDGDNNSDDGAEPAPGSELPPLAHWLYFLPHARPAALAPDGHPRRGGFLPPVPLPHRMWAGGRLDFRRALRVGDEVERRSTVAGVEAKQGRSGPLVFVTVRHEIMDGQGVALAEEHDIAYRGDPPPGTAPPPPAAAPTDEQFARVIVPDPVLLFRYSALTFNGHRIHYDRRYATEVEGYPGLVVHGPLVATLLVDLLRRERPDARLRAFAYRAASPLFDTAAFTVCGRNEDDHVSLWARDHAGRLAMQARAELA
jgi:3-methylfumaryl-CoA hydratase